MRVVTPSPGKDGLGFTILDLNFFDSNFLDLIEGEIESMLSYP